MQQEISAKIIELTPRCMMQGRDMTLRGKKQWRDLTPADMS
jgi:hypothetical protein